MNVEKETVLIVDDSEMNREILKSMLEDEYDILEAEDGAKAIQMISDHFTDIKLVLLDINMPVMDGKEVLRVMGNKLWMEHIPVVCISSDSTDETLKVAYDLGVVDYFSRPFDRESVLRRVHNMIHLYDKNNVDLRDAIGMLSAFFYRILKVNLSTGSFLPLKDNMEDISGKYGNVIDIYERLQGFAWKGYVHEEDKQEFLKFCSKDYILKRFDEGNSELTFQYRRKIGNSFHWMSIEFYRSTEYTDDHKAVLLCVRKINDDYLKQLDALRRKTDGIVGIVSINVSKGICAAGSSNRKELNLLKGREYIDDYIQRVSSFAIHEHEKLAFRQVINQKHLLEVFGNDERVIAVDASILDEESQEPVKIRCTVEMLQNSLTDDIEGLLYFSNITSQYLMEQMTKRLYQRNFDSVLILDARKKSLLMDAPESLGNGKFSKDIRSYEEYIETVLLKDVSEKDFATLRRKASLEKITSVLKTKERYSFVSRRLEKGEWRLKEHSFVLLNEEYQLYLGAVEDITEISRKDSLTSGLNRQGFIVNVDKILRRNESWGNYAILFFDAHNFKGINDLFGMSVGDLALREIYRRLSESVLNPLMTARIGSDHFACLVEREQVEDASLREVCKISFVEKNRTVPVSLRCGIYYPDRREQNVGTMLDLAEHAKESIKDKSDSPYKVFDESMRANYIDEAIIVAQVEGSLKNGDFKVYYQPIVDAKTKEIVSAEALVRWIHPEMGFVSPGLFIPVLEEKGHISDVDAYVVNHVSQFLRERKTRGAKDIPISVNYSRMDFYDSKLMAWTLKDLEERKELDISCRIEITETSVAAIGQDQDNLLKEMKNKGATMLMDDFGSGYSSFNMLQDYDFDILKIDREFIRKLETNEKSRGIVVSVINMAHALGMKVITEGVESKEQVDFLREHDCDYIQGFYFYRPLPEEEFKKLLD